MITEVNISIEDIASSVPNKILKIVHIAGQLDESNVDDKIQDIYKLVEANPKGLCLIFDLEKLDYMNSKSIGYLTDLYGKVTEGGGKIGLLKAKPNITDILQVVGLTQLIEMFDNLEVAKTKLMEGETQVPASTPAPAPVPAAPTPTPVAPVSEPAPTPAPATPAPVSTPDPVAPAPQAPASISPATPELAVNPQPAQAATAPAPTPEPPTPAVPATPTPTETPAPTQPAGTYNLNNAQ